MVTQKELNEVYTPQPDEVNFIFSMTRGLHNRFNAMLLLKSFQKLGYFPKLHRIPQGIVDYVREHLNLSPEVTVGYEKSRTMYAHQTGIRKHLGIHAYGKHAHEVAMHAIQQAAKTMDNPADLINLAIAELIHQFYLLDVFGILDQLYCRVRSLV